MVILFLFFCADLPLFNRFTRLWSCHFYLGRHQKEGKKYQHFSVSSYSKTHFQHTFYLRTWRLFSVFPSLWQTTILVLSRLVSISCKRRSTEFSRSFGATKLGIPEKSKHSLFEYCFNSWRFLLSSTSLLLIVLKASCRTFEEFCAIASWLVSSSFFFTNELILDIISNNFFDTSLFRCNKSFCCKSILSRNVKKDTIKFSFLISPTVF